MNTKKKIKGYTLNYTTCTALKTSIKSSEIP